jgi:hypothetical protein
MGWGMDVSSLAVAFQRHLKKLILKCKKLIGDVQRRRRFGRGAILAPLMFSTNGLLVVRPKPRWR